MKKRNLLLGLGGVSALMFPLVAVSCENSKQRKAKRAVDGFVKDLEKNSESIIVKGILEEWRKKLKETKWDTLSDEECDATIKAVDAARILTKL